MERLPLMSTLQEFPQLRRLQMFSPANQGLVADYLANMRVRHYGPTGGKLR